MPTVLFFNSFLAPLAFLRLSLNNSSLAALVSLLKSFIILVEVRPPNLFFSSSISLSNFSTFARLVSNALVVFGFFLISLSFFRAATFKSFSRPYHVSFLPWQL
jgi:hypothetical protein